MLPLTTELAPGATVGMWQDFVSSNPESASETDWGKTVTKFYGGRLKSRYLDPIKTLQSGPGVGEGFAIVAIQCSLIEFLESCYQGINYKYCPPGQQPGPNEYKVSLLIFRSFLSGRAPMKRDFTPALADAFYRGIRCGVLHEARTNGTWLVHNKSSSGQCVDATVPILYRDDLQYAIERFIDDYCSAVPGNLVLKQAFIRKFNHLCL